jgi:hypothetical protein
MLPDRLFYCFPDCADGDRTFSDRLRLKLPASIDKFMTEGKNPSG